MLDLFVKGQLPAAYETMATVASPAINFGRGILGYQNPFITRTMQDRMKELESQKGTSGTIGYEDYGLPVTKAGGRFTGGLLNLAINNPVDFGLAGSVGRYGFGPEGYTGLKYDFTPDKDTGSTGNALLDFINEGGIKSKLSSLGKTISDAVISPAYAPELDDIESIIEARKNREELNRIGSLALDDAGLNTAAMVDEFSQTSKPRFDVRNFLTNVKDKGIDMLGSGKELAFRGIGNLIAGPVGGFIGGAIGKMKTTPEQRLLKDFYEKETGLDSIGRIQGGIMQGYNPVSMFGPQGLTSAIDKRLATILKTEQKKKAKGLELSKKLIERRKQLEELKRKEEQARVDATRRMAQENRAAGTGGYQAGYDRDFMGGSGTAKDMGSS